jgi:hypothetical protein
MEKLTAFIKKNWLWIAVAVVVIIYLYTRKKKAESNFKSSRPSQEVFVPKNKTGITPPPKVHQKFFPYTELSKPGWFELRGSGYAWVERKDLRYLPPSGNTPASVIGSGLTFKYSGGSCSNGQQWFKGNDCPLFKFGATAGDRIYGYYDGIVPDPGVPNGFQKPESNNVSACNSPAPSIRVIKIVSYGGAKTFSFSNDTYAESDCVSPTNLNDDMLYAYPVLRLSNASLVRVG